MLLPADHKDDVLDHSVVELLLRSAVDWLRKVNTGDNGADVLLNLRNLHSLGGKHRRGSAHDLAPHIFARSLRRVRIAFRKAVLADRIGRISASIKPAMASTRAKRHGVRRGNRRNYMYAALI